MFQAVFMALVTIIIINFINILRAALRDIFAKKSQSQNLSREKLKKTISYKKPLYNVDQIDI